MDYSLLSRFRSELMGAAMLWVMLFHAIDLEFSFAPLNWVRAAGFGGVDIFILLSAMGLTMSLGRREQEYFSFMARRARRILPAYLVVMLPYTAYLAYTGTGHWSALVWNFLLVGYWIRCPGAFNWYVSGAMTFYALTPPTFSWLDSKRQRGQLLPWTGGAIALSFLFCRLLIHEGYWYILDFCYRIPVFLLGMALGFFILDHRRFGRRDLIFWLLWSGLGLLYLMAHLAWKDVSDIVPLCPLFLFSTVPMCLVLCLCFQHLPLGSLRRFLRLVGENSLEIYLLNVSLFPLAATAIGPGNFWDYLPALTANLLLGILLHWGVDRLLHLVQSHRGPSA